MVIVESQTAEEVGGVLRVVVDLMAVALHPPPVMGSRHALVLVLPPERRHHVVVLEEVARFVHQRWVSPARQHKSVPLPMVPTTKLFNQRKLYINNLSSPSRSR